VDGELDGDFDDVPETHARRSAAFTPDDSEAAPAARKGNDGRTSRSAS
jgi:hypothetical protein